MSENWQQIKDIFALAEELPREKREVFLRENCTDPQIYDEVKSLLDASDETQKFIENDSFSPAKIFPALKNYDSTKFGHYTVLREIGRGGMGAVFLAERNDGEFEQKVALKIIRQSFGGGEIERYFRRERQILATLNHPFIARLLDGGVSDAGELFLAMEYVEGEELLAFCKRKNLEIDARLHLFLKICRAVSYAHQNLVVHRDLKPSNILINKDGEPKLLDFGLAKDLGFGTSDFGLSENKPENIESEIPNAESQIEITQLRAFTPAYASPEQITGKNVTTASDVYSLGVIFYELLSGAKPFDFEGKNLEEIIKTITDREPIAPSSIQKLNLKTQTPHNPKSQIPNPKLNSDLDSIALKALQKEAEKRYKSVEEFANDIERHLNGLPISARPATVAYRAKKFFRRNIIAVSATIFVIFALILGLTIALWQANVARTERDRAEKRFNDVRKLSNSLLFEITPKIERLQGSTEAREILVKRALEYLDSLAQESQNDFQLQSELASAYEKIGELQGNPNKPSLNDYSGAIESYQKARNIRLNLPQTTENQIFLAENYRRFSDAVFTQNDVKGSLESSLESLKIYEKLLRENPNSFDLQIAFIETNLQYGTTHSINNKYSEAIPIFEKSILDLVSLDQNNRETLKLKATALAQLGNALSWDNKQTEAEAKMTEAVKIIDELVEKNPNDSLIRRDAFRIYGLASSIYEEIKNDISLEFAQKSLQIAIRAVESDAADSQAKSNLARAYSRVGICFVNLKRISEATSNLTKSQNLLLELNLQEPKNLAYKRDLARLLVRFGDAQTVNKNYAAAVESYQKSADLFETIGATDEKNTLAKRDLAQSLKSVGETYLEMNEKSKAKLAFQKSFEILQNLIRQNALGEFDRKMLDNVQTALQKL